MILFYTNQLNSSRAVLDEEEFRHCCKVLRHREGDIINVTDGSGSLAEARIVKCGKKHADLEIISIKATIQNSKKITIGIAPPKNRARWEWFLEKSVEIGVDRIIPLVCQNSERKKINLERNKKILRSAALQSLCTFHPSLSATLNLKSFVSSLDKDDTDLYVAHFRPDNPDLKSLSFKTDHQLILIGPEGDFSPSEMEYLLANGFKSVNISENRLRTETAGLVALLTISNAD